MIMMMLMVTTMTTMIVVAGTVPASEAFLSRRLSSNEHILAPPRPRLITYRRPAAIGPRGVDVRSLLGSTLKKITHCFRVISAVFSHSWVV